MKLVQIIPLERKRLYGAMVKREAAIRKKGAGTFYRAGARKRNGAKWKHTRYKGWINLERGLSEVVTAEVNSLVPDEDWQLLSAFLGWIDRHFGDQVLAVNIQYQ
jgi:hypothetical protein